MARLLEQKKRAAGEGEPWIERFMKFADAMYKTDRSNDGKSSAECFSSTGILQ